MGSQNYIRGPCATWMPLTEKKLYPIDYFTISNCVFNFSFLFLVLYEIVGWSQIYIRGRYVPSLPPSGKIFYTQSEYFCISNCVFNFNFLALIISEILGGCHIHTRGAYAPITPPSREIFVR